MLAINFLLAEGGLRIYHFFSQERRSIHIPDFYLGYVHSKNNRFIWKSIPEHPEYRTFHATNALGLLRSTEVMDPKGAPIERILILGDSFTEALQVNYEESFSSRLEFLLNGNLPVKHKRLEVLNAGVRGYSPIVHYLNFKRSFLPLSPDVVIVQLCPNDVFEDNRAKPKTVFDANGLPLKINIFYSNGVSESLRINPALLKIHRWLLEKSRFYEYAYIQSVKAGKKSRMNQEMRKRPPYDDGYQFFIIQDHDNDALFQENNFLERTWKDTQNYLLSLKALVESRGAKFLIIYIPIEAQLKLDHYGENARLFFSGQASDRLNQLLRKFADTHHVGYIDFLPILQAHQDKPLYFNWDGHLTKDGHAIVAQTLFEYLRRDTFLDAN